MRKIEVDTEIAVRVEATPAKHEGFAVVLVVGWGALDTKIAVLVGGNFQIWAVKRGFGAN